MAVKYKKIEKKSTETTPKTVQVGADGKAPSGLNVGDKVNTAGGTYKIDAVNSDGTYKSSLVGSADTRPGADWVWDGNKGTGGNTATSTNTTTSETYADEMNRLKRLQQEATTQQLKAQKEKALQSLAEQEAEIQPKYYEARRQATATSQKNARNFAEYLAARGLTNSGAAAQGEINRQSALQNTLGQLGTAEAQDYAQIARARQNVAQDYATGLANANAQLEADYYQNIIAENQRQRQIDEQLRQQAMAQYSNDYQGEINNLLAQGYSPNSREVLTLQALRGQKVANNTANAYNYNTSMAKIQSGIYDYNDLLATGLNEAQAQQIYQNAVAVAQAQAEQQAFENQINLMKAQATYNNSIKRSSGSSSGTQQANTLSTRVSNLMSQPAETNEQADQVRQMAANEILNGATTEEEAITLANENGITIEQLARAMVQNNYTEEQIKSFISHMVPNISQNYMNNILRYAGITIPVNEEQYLKATGGYFGR